MSDMTGIIVDELNLQGEIQSASSPLNGLMRSSDTLAGQIEGSRGPKGDPGPPGPQGPPGPAGTSDYNDLSNKPQINGVTLQGNKSFNELGFTDIIINCGTSTTVIGEE